MCLASPISLVTDISFRVKIIRWVTESTRPANIVADPGFDALMKIGRPTTVIPSPRQVARDIHAAFVICRSRISELLQVCVSALHHNPALRILRTIAVLLVLQRTHGHLRTTVPSLHGRCIWSTRVILSRFFLILSKYPK